ncbi:sugar phosphate isomerase [Clostridia bacterium]|nr:sugar phosphate isomerase [Clostridia bacterium]
MAAKIGLQIYSIRDIYAKDLKGSLKLVKDSGYDAVDFFGGVKINAQELKGLLDEIGLEVAGWHVPWEYLSRPDLLEMFVTYNKVIGNKYLISPGLPGEYTKDAATWLEGANKLNEIAASLKKYGFRTGLHNHSAEFAALEGTTDQPWDIVAKNTSDDVVLQLDLGNALSGGKDPLEILKRYSGRNQTIHFKPFSKSKGFGVPVGEDDIDWKEVIKFCKTSGNTEYFIVEYEENDPEAGIKASVVNLRKLLA